MVGLTIDNSAEVFRTSEGCAVRFRFDQPRPDFFRTVLNSAGITVRDYLSLKQIAGVLGVSPTYAGQAIAPAIAKVARLLNAYPAETIRLILDAADEQRRADDMAALELLERRQVGRLNRSELGHRSAPRR